MRKRRSRRRGASSATSIALDVAPPAGASRRSAARKSRTTVRPGPRPRAGRRRCGCATQPARPRAVAAPWTKGRKPTPCTTPVTRTATRIMRPLDLERVEPEAGLAEQLAVGAAAARAEQHVVLGRVGVAAGAAARLDVRRAGARGARPRRACRARVRRSGTRGSRPRASRSRRSSRAPTRTRAAPACAARASTAVEQLARERGLVHQRPGSNKRAHARGRRRTAAATGGESACDVARGPLDRDADDADGRGDARGRERRGRARWPARRRARASTPARTPRRRRDPPARARGPRPAASRGPRRRARPARGVSSRVTSAHVLGRRAPAPRPPVRRSRRSASSTASPTPSSPRGGLSERDHPRRASRLLDPHRQEVRRAGDARVVVADGLLALAR